MDRGLVVGGACLAALLGAPSAMAQDRTDAIPTSVGPPGGVAFHVNPAVPAGMSASRYASVVDRSLARWGDTDAGPTGAAGGGAADGVNVISIGALPANVLGRQTEFTTTTTTTAPDHRACTDSGDTVDDETTVRSTRRARLTLRRDVRRGGSVRHRVVRRTVSIPTLSAHDNGTKPVEVCRGQSQVEVPEVTVESDIVLAPSPGGDGWAMGPAKPTSTQWDFETNLLHELGHASGLAHQANQCDPSTPLPTSLAAGTWWHAIDDWNHADCAKSLVPADTAGVDSAAPLATTLNGAAVWVNPAVPAGYDRARFLQVAQRDIVRAGGTYAGTTTAAPNPGDDQSTLGFAPLAAQNYLQTFGTPVSVTRVTPAHGDCEAGRVQIRVPSVVRARHAGLRRDRIAQRLRSISAPVCTDVPSSQEPQADDTEHDMVLSTLDAWEFGPGHPVTGTRIDLETVVLQGLMQMAGDARITTCSTTTPNSPLVFGDWWRSTADTSRARCANPATPDRVGSRTTARTFVTTRG